MTAEEAWQLLFTKPETFLSANNLEIGGMSDRVAGNYRCFLKADDVSSYTVKKWGKESPVPTWRITVLPPNSPDIPGAYRIPQVCFYVPMYEHGKVGSPVQSHAAVTGDAEVVVTGQLNACQFAVCGSEDQLHVAHIRPRGIGPAGATAEAAQGRQKAMTAFLKEEMPTKPNIRKSSEHNPVTVIGVKRNGKFKFYAQVKYKRAGPKACQRLTGVTAF